MRGTPSFRRTAAAFTLLGERVSDEIALGLVGKFWRPAIEYAEIEPDRFKGFDRPGYAKTIYVLGVRPLDGDCTLAWAVIRTATTDTDAATVVSPLLDSRS